MTKAVSDDLMATVVELRALFPDWRLGQLVASLTQAAGRDRDGAIWDVEDEELLAAARRLVDRNRPHRVPKTDPTVAPGGGGATPLPGATAPGASRPVS